MTRFKDNLLLAAMALALSAAFSVAWISGLWIDVHSSLARGLLVLAAFLVVAIPAWVVVRQGRRQIQAAIRSLESLCLLDYRDLCDETNSLSEVEPGNPGYDILRRVNQRFVDVARRLADAQDVRAALELRARHNASEHRRIAAILTSLADPILVVDQYGDLVLANRSAEALFGFDSADAGRVSVSQLAPCERILELLDAALRHKASTARSAEVQLQLTGGDPRWYRVSVNGYACDENDDPSLGARASGAVVSLRDISEQKDAGRRHAEFVSAVSHEMKTPLAGIQAYAEMLVDGEAEDDVTREEFLTVINSQADRLARLIDNLLNLARIESGVVKVRKEPRSLNELLEEAASVVRYLADDKGIRLTSDLSPMYLGVLADRDQLLQAAINLLSNAIKYTQPGGEITLRSRGREGEAMFDVEDSGVGLNAEDREKIFGKFYRVTGHQHMASGTGLGLPLAKSIVEDVHGGQLTVKSELGQGSVFTVTLPAAAELAKV